MSDNKVYYILNDAVSYFNFVNIPGRLSKDDILKTLNLTDQANSYIRFYKKYLCWVLVSDNIEFCEKFEKTLKTIKFVEDANLRYEYQFCSLKKNLVRKVQQQNYNKESSDHKAYSSGNFEKEKDNKLWMNNYNSNDSANPWRKQSNDYTANKDDSKYFAGKTNSSKKFNENYKTNSFTNEIPGKRERFNSDGDSNKFQNPRHNGNSSYFSVFQNPIKLDYSKLNLNYDTQSINYFM